ncbi:LysR family transcriptional regulator [Achromobacter xylosoxidans]|uniref:LysR family transcriptional regulator n=1 Tax=Alcaligenes xylosoxydans xylosoxydans TaxID=85698 RepID=UPI001EEF279E|nr:LysR family transcriptional regulator [Achromobacter xylosoxidans]
MLSNVSDLDLRLIRVFLTIVDAGGVSAAQALLGVGQSTISSQLATLETRLGFTLCERGRGGFRLSAKGQRFDKLARRALASLDDFSAQARNMHRQLVGNLTLGLIGNATMAQNARIGHAIEKFRRRDEAVRLSVLIRSPRELEELILKDEMQVAIGYFLHRVPMLDYTPLFQERQVAYCGASHPLAARAGRVTEADVADADWTWRTYPLPESSFAGRPRHITSEADNMEAALILILSGAHLGYLPEHYAAPYVTAGLLHALDADAYHYDVEISMVAKRRSHLDDIAAAFLEDMRAALLAAPDATP